MDVMYCLKSKTGLKVCGLDLQDPVVWLAQRLLLSSCEAPLVPV